MPWTRFLARLLIPVWTRRPVPPKAARASRIIIVRPRVLTAPQWLRTKKKIRERMTYVVRGLDSRLAGCTFPGGALTTARPPRPAAKHHHRRIAIFGGSFDPIHNGHLSVARAADRRFNFDGLHFIPASRPPHKLKQHLAPFPHRFAMVSLASTEHPHFVPSLAEAGEDFSGTQLHYSVDTVRYFRHVYHGHGDRLFFIIGADAFLDIPMWKEYETLLGLCDFIIAKAKQRFVLFPHGDVQERVGADDEKEAIAVAVVDVTEVTHGVHGIVELRAAEILSGFGKRGNKVRMLGASERDHRKPVRERREMLL